MARAGCASDRTASGALTLTNGVLVFPDGSEQARAAAFSARPPLPLTHNLVNNGMMSRVDEDGLPEGYSTARYQCTGCTMDVAVVHTYTQCFEGPYISTATAAEPSWQEILVDHCGAATETNPYWFGNYNMGPRIKRGGMGGAPSANPSGKGGGWGSRNDGRLLKLTGSRPAGDEPNGKYRRHMYLRLPIESRHISSAMLFRAYIKVVRGGCSFGTDMQVRISYTRAHSEAAVETQGWLQVHELLSSAHSSNQDHQYHWNLKVRSTLRPTRNLPHASGPRESRACTPTRHSWSRRACFRSTARTVASPTTRSRGSRTARAATLRSTWHYPTYRHAMPSTCHTHAMYTCHTHADLHVRPTCRTFGCPMPTVPTPTTPRIGRRACRSAVVVASLSSHQVDTAVKRS